MRVATLQRARWYRPLWTDDIDGGPPRWHERARAACWFALGAGLALLVREVLL